MAKFANTDWPARLWIVRHGQSAGNVARDLAEQTRAEQVDLQTRDADTPLSDLGGRQANALAAWFARLPAAERPQVVLTSPFLRSRETATTIAARVGLVPADVRSDERLREKEFGILDRYTKQGIASKFPGMAAQRALVGKFYFRPPGGESWCDVILRLRSVLEELRRDEVGCNVLIVAHQVTVNCFRYLLEALDERAILEIDRDSDVPNCSITEYRLFDAPVGASFDLVRANFIVPLLETHAPITRAPDVPMGPK